MPKNKILTDSEADALLQELYEKYGNTLSSDDNIIILERLLETDASREQLAKFLLTQLREIEQGYYHIIKNQGRAN